MRKLILIAGIVCSAIALRANEIQDLLRMNSFYQSQKSLYMEFDVLLKYVDAPQNEERRSCLLTSDKTRSYYKVMHTEYVNDGKFSLFIDHAEKIAVVSDYENPEETEALLKKFSVSNSTDTAELKKQYTIRYIGGAHNAIRMLPKDKEDENESIDIYFNPDYSLSKVVYVMRDTREPGPRMTSYSVIYKKQQTRAETAYFDSGKYIRPKKGKLEAAPGLSGYKIIDKRKRTH